MDKNNVIELERRVIGADPLTELLHPLKRYRYADENLGPHHENIVIVKQAFHRNEAGRVRCLDRTDVWSMSM